MGKIKTVFLNFKNNILTSKKSKRGNNLHIKN